MKKGMVLILAVVMLCSTLVGCKDDEEGQKTGGAAIPDSSDQDVSYADNNDDSSEDESEDDEDYPIADWYIEMPSIGKNYIDDVELTENEQIDRREGVRVYKIKGTDEETKVLKCVTEEFGEFTKEVMPFSYNQEDPESLVAELKFEDEKAILKEFRILLNEMSGDYEKGKEPKDFKEYFDADVGNDTLKACHDAFETREDKNKSGKIYNHKFNYTALKQSEEGKSYLEDEYIVLKFRFDLAYERVIDSSVSGKEVKGRESTVKVIKNKDGKYVISEILDIELFRRDF